MDLHYYFKTECGKAHALNKRKNFIALYKHFRRNTQHSYCLEDSQFNAIQKATEMFSNSSVVKVFNKYHAIFFGNKKERNNRTYLQILKPDGLAEYVHESELTA